LSGNLTTLGIYWGFHTFLNSYFHPIQAETTEESSSDGSVSKVKQA